MANDFEHAASKNCDDNKFRHAHHALVHGGKPAKHVIRAHHHADDACEENADAQTQQDIHATDGKNDDCQIGEHQPEIRLAHLCRGADTFAQEEIDDEHHQSHRRHNADVYTEFVLHAATLCLCCHDGGVADEGEIVAKVCATHHKTNHHRGGDARLLSDARSQRSECGNGATTGAYAQRNEA